jgi:O-antigen/teichoic acid export membrane protein
MTAITAPAISAATIRRGWWLALARTSDHAVTFGLQVLIARWVGPAEFGALATALLVVTILDSLTESGLAAALVHRSEVDDEHLDVAWTIGILRGVGLALLMLAIAPAIADLVDAPDATGLIRVLAVVPVLRSLRSGALPVLERRLAFGRMALCGLAESTVLLLGTLCLMSFVAGVAPLVAGVVLGECARVLASYAVARHRPRLRFDAVIAGQLLRYGRWVTGSSIALLALLYMDDAVVGATLGAASLAVYAIAYQVAGVPATEISLVGGQVAFNAMARVRDDRTRLTRYFLDSYELVAALAVPIAVGLMVLATPLVDFVLGARWDEAAPVIMVLAPWGVLRALGAVMTALFRAEGRPDISARQHWTMVVVTGIVLVPLVEVAGLVGAAVAVLVPNLLIHWLRYRDVAQVVDVQPQAIRRRLVGPVLAGIAMAAATALTAWAAASAGPGWSVASGAVIGLAIYVLVLFALDRAGHSHAFQRAVVLMNGGRR